MTINTAAYTVGSNYPLNHARILYAPLTGTVTGDGTNPGYAANDYTSQRWKLAPGANSWTLTTAAAAELDCVFIAAHNLAGKVVTIASSSTADGLGPQLITNSTFNTGITGWAAFGTGATLTWDAGNQRAQVETTAQQQGMSTTVSLVPGKDYLIKATITNGASSSRTYRAVMGAGLSGFVTVPAGATQIAEFYIVGADSSTLVIRTGGVFTPDAGEKHYFDNVSANITDNYVSHCSITPADNSTICALFNNAGTAYGVRQVRVSVNDGTDVAIGVIWTGKALQMPIPIYGGHRPLNLNRVTEAQQQFSETGQWLGRIVKRRAVTTGYQWDYLSADWYDANFEPFALTLPLNPFFIAGNPSKITSDVGFVWTDRDVEPSQMGVNTYRSVSLNVTGYY